MSDQLAKEYRSRADKHERAAEFARGAGYPESAEELREVAADLRQMADDRDARLRRAPFPIIKTQAEMEKLLDGSEDATIVLRDQGGYVWVSSGYTHDGIWLTLTPGPHSFGTAMSMKTNVARLYEFAPFTVIYDSRNDEDPAPQTHGAAVIIEDAEEGTK